MAPPPKAGPVGESDAEDESVGDATGLAGASVCAAVGLTGSGDGAGAVEAADDAAAEDAEAVAAFCTAPDEPAVVDEHPAIAAVASTSPAVAVHRLPLALGHRQRNSSAHKQSRLPQLHSYL